MDRIKQALEIAREQRELKRGASRNVDIIAGSAEPIIYTETPSIEIPKRILEENRIIHNDSPSAYTDSIKLLRTQVFQRMDENNWNSLAITSAESGTGKTLTAINLSINMAMEVGYTVLLVDANLREPAMHKLFGVKPAYGLSDYLKDNVPLSDALIHPDGFDNFVIMPGGQPLKNSSEMLSSPRMSALVEELKHRYPKRMIIFDLPSLLDSSDTLAFMPYVDTVLLVIEEGRTKTNDLNKSVDMLSSTNILGTVLNKALL